VDTEEDHEEDKRGGRGAAAADKASAQPPVRTAVPPFETMVGDQPSFQTAVRDYFSRR
jgi:hypothetical protein